MDNTSNRLQNDFFYGLYMDPDILKQKNVEPRNPRIGFAENYTLRIGQYATLLRQEGQQAHGILYSLTHDEIDTLYAKAGLDMYVAEAISVKLENGQAIACLCCNLLQPPKADESNADYQTKLVACMTKYGILTPDING